MRGITCPAFRFAVYGVICGTRPQSSKRITSGSAK